MDTVRTRLDFYCQGDGRRSGGRGREVPTSRAKTTHQYCNATLAFLHRNSLLGELVVPSALRHSRPSTADDIASRRPQGDKFCGGAPQCAPCAPSGGERLCERRREPVLRPRPAAARGNSRASTRVPARQCRSSGPRAGTHRGITRARRASPCGGRADLERAAAYPGATRRPPGGRATVGTALCLGRGGQR
jgi:hypothetical protein